MQESDEEITDIDEVMESYHVDTPDFVLTKILWECGDRTLCGFPNVLKYRLVNRQWKANCESEMLWMPYRGKIMATMTPRDRNGRSFPTCDLKTFSLYKYSRMLLTRMTVMSRLRAVHAMSQQNYMPIMSQADCDAATKRFKIENDRIKRAIASLSKSKEDGREPIFDVMTMSATRKLPLAVTTIKRKRARVAHV